MPDIDGIVDGESFEAWLGETDQPREACVALAYRAAMRAAPLYLRDAPPLRPGVKLMTTPVLRCLLISGVEAVEPTAEGIGAAFSPAAAEAAAHLAADDAFLAAAAAFSAARAATTTAVAAASAAAAAVSEASRYLSWETLRRDCRTLMQEGDLVATPLWPGEGAENRSTHLEIDRDIHEGWAAAGPLWRFWSDWYRAALLGQPMEIGLLTRIALIDNAVWEQGDEAVNERIWEIYRDWQASHPPQAESVLARDLAESVHTLPAARLRVAIENNKKDLPPNLDAIGFLIQNEVARLQSTNYQSDDHMEECQRLIRVFVTLHDAASRMAELIPTERETTDADAEEIKPLLKVYAEQIAEWPRGNAAEVVDGSFRLGLVGGSAWLIATLMGAPFGTALLASGLAYGGKKLASGAKDLAASLKSGSEKT